ncbi:MAG: hypothetical protein JSR18_13130 [Proteobacteria bacterium]|nr:hypothetical protein [Pseudomonadota bacterium]
MNAGTASRPRFGRPLRIRTLHAFAWEPWLVAAITVAFVALGAWMAAGYDSGRDVAAAWAIAWQDARPTTGPLFAGHVYLGPLWFYALALPLAAVPAWLTAALTAAVIAALQFPLAYLAGTRLADRRLGMLWAVALALPGWASFESVGFASTNLVCAAVLGTLYALIRVRDAPRVGWWLAAGLGASIAVHAHPSTAWLAAVVGWQALRHPGAIARHFRDAVVALAAAFVGFALPFLPLLGGFDTFATSVATTANANVAVIQWARLPRLAGALVWDGAPMLFAMLRGAGDTARWLGTVASVLALVGAIAGTWLAWRARGVARLAFALTLVPLAFVAVIRPTTPLYMLYTVMPGYALLVACGWTALGRVAQPVIVIAALLLAGTAGASLVQAQYRGGGPVDGARVVDVLQAPSPRVAADVWLPAWGVDALGRWLCDHPAPVYGALPYLIDVHYTMPLRIHCPELAPALARPLGNTGWVGLARRQWRTLGIAPTVTIAGIGIAPAASVLTAPQPRDWPLTAQYPPHAPPAVPPTSVERADVLPPHALLVLANTRATWMPDWSAEIRCNDAPATLAASDAVTRVYRCAAGDPDARGRWTFGIQAADPHAIEVVAIAGRGNAALR